jgi:hypothetical protein
MTPSDVAVCCGRVYVERRRRFVKFQNVRSLTLFIESNQNDEDTTALHRIQLLGSLCVRRPRKPTTLSFECWHAPDGVKWACVNFVRG